MRQMTSGLNVLFFMLLCTLTLKLCQSSDCDYTESYDEIVTVSVQEPVTITKYKWCMDIPPRCPDIKQEYRTVHKNITVPKTRTVKKCCKNQLQLYDNCVPKCTEDNCPNIQCAPGTDKCKCKPGYTGHLCRQMCLVGRWGVSCQMSCHPACSDCDHRTGCCKKRVADGHAKTTEGLTYCRTTAGPIVTVAARQTSRDGDDDETDWPPRFGPRQSMAATEETNVVSQTVTEVETQEPLLSVTTVDQSQPGETNDSLSSSPPKRRKDGGGGFIRSVTKLEVTVYKYDELIKKLIWISAMTVVAIAMVFILMFVVFFNCYGASKPSDRSESLPQTSLTSNKYRETCINTPNHGYVPPDRYTKTPGLQTSTNVDLPIHPEIFCPVFSAPHNTGVSSLYDSPQPLYEILC